MPDPERAAWFAMHFIAGLVLLRAAYQVAAGLLGAWRARRAILAIAAEIDRDAREGGAREAPTVVTPARRGGGRPRCIWCRGETHEGWLCEACQRGGRVHP